MQICMIEQLKATPFDPNSASILAVALDAPMPRPMPKKGTIRNKWAIKLDLDNDEGFSDMCLSNTFVLHDSTEEGPGHVG